MIEYFCHPTNLSTMDEVLRLRMDRGAAGYGLFILLLEALREAPGYRIKHDPEAIAWLIHEPDRDSVEKIIINYDLFRLDDEGFVYSPWLSEAMAPLDTKRAKLSAAGRKSAAIRKGEGNEVSATLQPPSSEVATSSKPINIFKPSILDKLEPTNQEENVVGGDIFDDNLIKEIGHAASPPFDPEKDGDVWIKDGTHNPGILSAAALCYKLTSVQAQFMYGFLNRCEIGHPRVVAFLAAVKHCRETKFTPSFPFEYFVKKIRFA